MVYLDLKPAKALRDLDLETHVVEFAPRLMAVQIDDLGGKVLRRKIEDLGVKVHTQKRHNHRMWQQHYTCNEICRW